VTQLVLGLAVAPVVIGLVILCLREPLSVALPAYAVTIPFGQLLAVGPSRFGSLSSILGVLLGVGLVLQRLRTREHNVRVSPTVPLWLLFLGVAGATVSWSVNPGKTEIGFLVLSSLVLIYVFVSLNDVDRVALDRTENGLLLGGVAVTCYGLFQLLVQGGFPGDAPGSPIQPDGRFGNDLLGPNNEAVALLIPLMIVLSRAVGRPARSQRVLYTLISAFLLLGILMTGSRGGILATIVAVVALAFSISQGRRKLLAYAGVAVAVGAFVFLTQPGGLAERNVETTSSSGRTDIWQVALAACPEYCPVGSGWETFPDVYSATQPSVPGAEVLVGGGGYEPHNVWILVAIELGLPGLILLFAVLSVTLAEAVKLPAQLRAPPLAGYVATLFAAFFLSNLEYKFFWMSLIYVALSRNLAKHEANEAHRQQLTESADPMPAGRLP